MIFELSPEQVEKYEKWRKHGCDLEGNAGAIGGRITFEFTPTSLGVIETVRCGCGEKLTLTDFEDW